MKCRDCHSEVYGLGKRQVRTICPACTLQRRNAYRRALRQRKANVSSKWRQLLDVLAGS